MRKFGSREIQQMNFGKIIKATEVELFGPLMAEHKYFSYLCKPPFYCWSDCLYVLYWIGACTRASLFASLKLNSQTKLITICSFPSTSL